MQHEMRRADRALALPETHKILDAAEYGILSTISPDNEPYGVPLNFCVLNGTIYFHCAGEGRKLDNIAHDSRVSFCVVGHTELLPEKFSTRYESVIVTGRSAEVDGAEKQHALEGLVTKYSTEFSDQGLEYIQKLTHKTKVCRITIESISGKARR